jgi:hypothetical protein
MQQPQPDPPTLPPRPQGPQEPPDTRPRPLPGEPRTPAIPVPPTGPIPDSRARALSGVTCRASKSPPVPSIQKVRKRLQEDRRLPRTDAAIHFITTARSPAASHTH